MTGPRESTRASEASTVSVPQDFWLLAVYEVVRNRWGLILSCVVAGLLLSLAIAIFMTPVYEAKVVMVPSFEDQSADAIGGLLGGLGGVAALGTDLMVGGEKSEALAILKSRSFTEAFIGDFGLLPILFADEWNSESGEWKTDDSPTLYDGYVMFEDDIRRIAEDLGDGTVTLSIFWRDREQAVDWANTLVQRLNETMRAGAISEARETLSYLNEELQKTDVVQLEQAIYSLVEDNVRAIALANVRKEYAFRVIDPAAPLNDDAFVRPKRNLIVIVGTGLGLLCGLFVGFAVTRIRVAYAGTQ